uniref:Uncharacterized protein n=1 Tax=Anguilla anguilla TaxID=7936 RepID=A0A0E9XG54_ANGAN
MICKPSAPPSSAAGSSNRRISGSRDAMSWENRYGGLLTRVLTGPHSSKSTALSTVRSSCRTSSLS